MLRKPHGLAVVALPFRHVVEPRKEEHGVGRGSRLDGFFAQFSRICAAFRIALAIGVGNALELEGFLGGSGLRGVDHRAARALIAHLFEHLADDEQLFFAREREGAVVF